MEVQSAARTYHPIHVYELSWAMDNFSKNPKKASSQTFYPMSDLSNKCYLEFFTEIAEEYVSTTVYLSIDALTLSTYNLSGDITLSNVNGSVLKSSNIHYERLEGNSSVPVTDITLKKSPGGLELENLPANRLVIKAKLSFKEISPLSGIANYKLRHRELSNDFRNMFEYGYGHDVVFSVDGNEIPAHRSVLLSRAPLFSKQFDQPHATIDQNFVAIPEQEVTLYNVLYSFLIFLYTGEVDEQNCKVLLALYTVAVEYQVDRLREECSRLLAKTMAVDSFCRVLTLAEQFKDLPLKESSKMFFRKNFNAITGQTAWKDIGRLHPHLNNNFVLSLYFPSSGSGMGDDMQPMDFVVSSRSPDATITTGTGMTDTKSTITEDKSTITEAMDFVVSSKSPDDNITTGTGIEDAKSTVTDTLNTKSEPS